MNKRENAKSNWQKKKIDGQVDEGVIGWGEREIKQKKWEKWMKIDKSGRECERKHKVNVMLMSTERSCCSAAERLIHWLCLSAKLHSASHHMSSSRWDANYRRERKTLSSLLPCSDFPFLLFLKTFMWFSRHVPHRGEPYRPAVVQLYFVWIKKIPQLPKSPSPLRYFLSFSTSATFL